MLDEKGVALVKRIGAAATLLFVILFFVSGKLPPSLDAVRNHLERNVEYFSGRSARTELHHASSANTWGGRMATFNVSTAAQLSAALASAHAGDTILLAGGSYGDFAISNLSFSSQVTIESADPTNPAVFSTISMNGAHGLTFENIEVHFVPNATTVAWDSAVKITNSSDITIVHSNLVGGLAVNGVPQSATTLDSTQDVIGMPAARAITVSHSSNVQILNDEISTFDRGIVLDDVTGMNISGNEIHDLRRTPIDGGDVSKSLIENNYIHDINPWHWGSGDHADFIHIWTVPTEQTGPSDGLVIKDNYLAQGSGTAVLGIYLDDNNNGLGFTGAQIVDNVVYNGNAQGLRLESVMNSTVDGNVLIQSSGILKVGPGIITAGSTQGLSITHNVISGLDLSHLTGDSRGNILVQDADPSLPHYDGIVEGSALSWAQAMDLRQHLTGEAFTGTTVPGADAGIQTSSDSGTTGTGGSDPSAGTTTTGGSAGAGSSTSTPAWHLPHHESKTAVPQVTESTEVTAITGTTTNSAGAGHGSGAGLSHPSSDQFVFTSMSIGSSGADHGSSSQSIQTGQASVTNVQESTSSAVLHGGFDMSFAVHDLFGLHQIHVDHLFS